MIALLVLGPKRLPEVGRSLGRGLRDFRSAMSGDDDPRQDELHPQATAMASQPQAPYQPQAAYQPQPPPQPAYQPQPVFSAPQQPEGAPHSAPVTDAQPQAAPAQAAPAQALPAQALPVQSAPVQAAPAQPAPEPADPTA